MLLLLLAEVIFEGKSLLCGTETKVAALSKLRMVLVVRADFFAIVEHRVFFHNVFDVHIWQDHVGLMPSLLHDLGKVIFVLLGAVTAV